MGPVRRKVNVTKDEDEDEEDDEESVGSQVVVGLFHSLRQFTQNVGKLVNIVGDRLDDRRDHVVKVASNVDSQVTHIGDNLIRWKKKTFGIGNKETSFDGEDEDVIIVEDENYNEENEETTFSSVV